MPICCLGLLEKLIQKDPSALLQKMYPDALMLKLVNTLFSEEMDEKSYYQVSILNGSDGSFMQACQRTEASMVRDKSPEQPPSAQLKFSLQIPVYKEMPSEDENDIGNVPQLLLSIVNSALSYDEEGDIEVLFNVNNAPSLETAPIPVPIGNTHTLLLINSLKTATSPEDFLDAISIVVEHRDAQTSEIRVLFYRRLFNRYRELIDKRPGFQLHAIDCTDGRFVASLGHMPYGQRRNPTQGARRRLLSSIALSRFSASHVPDSEQLMCFLDADVRLGREYFQQLALALSDGEYRAISMPTRLTSGTARNLIITEAGNRPALTSKLFLGLVRSLSDGDSENIDYNVPISPSTFVCTVEAYKKVPGWDISLEVGEDSGLINSKANLNS